MRPARSSPPPASKGPALSIRAALSIRPALSITTAVRRLPPLAIAAVLALAGAGLPGAGAAGHGPQRAARAQLLSAAGAPAPCPPVPGQPAGGSPRIMVVGDSLSEGSAGDYTWRYRLYEQLAAGGLRPAMVGPYNWLFDNVTGRQGSCAYAEPAFENAHDAIWGRMMSAEMMTIGGEVSRYKPDYLLVLLGINDLTFGLGTAGLEADLQAFVASARAARPGLRIVLGLLLPKAGEPAILAGRVARYNADLPGLAARMSTPASPVVIADDASQIRPSADLWDGTHPDAAGELKIAAGFASALSADFGLGSPFPAPLPEVPPGPRQPPRLAVTAGAGAITLAWQGSPGATGYAVFLRDATSGGGWQQLPYPLALSDSPWTDSGLEPGDTYQVRLQADKGTAHGVFSNTAAAAVPGAAPGGAALQAARPGRAGLAAAGAACALLAALSAIILARRRAGRAARTSRGS